MQLVIPMPAGKMLSSDGVTWIDKFPPGYLLATDLGTHIDNTNTETTILAGGATAGVFPAGIAVGDAVHIRAAGTWKNNTGAGQTLTINPYMGGTSLGGYTGPSFASSANLHNWLADLEIIYTIIGGAGVGAVRMIGQLWIAMGGGTGFTAPTALTDFAINDAAAFTIATNAAATGDLKAQMSTATSGGTVTCNIFRARYFPKNY